jgi:hypothetical protein
MGQAVADLIRCGMKKLTPETWMKGDLGLIQGYDEDAMKALSLDDDGDDCWLVKDDPYSQEAINAFSKSASKFCAIGSLYACSGAMKPTITAAVKLLNKAVLDADLATNGDAALQRQRGIVDINDREDSTLDEVLPYFEAAAQLAEASDYKP